MKQCSVFINEGTENVYCGFSYKEVWLTSGVSQGSILRPLCLNIVMSDI